MFKFIVWNFEYLTMYLDVREKSLMTQYLHTNYANTLHLITPVILKKKYRRILTNKNIRSYVRTTHGN